MVVLKTDIILLLTKMSNRGNYKMHVENIFPEENKWVFSNMNQFSQN
jgi:hypothetical protein